MTTTQPDTRPAIRPEVGKRFHCRNGWITPDLEFSTALIWPFHPKGQACSDMAWAVNGRFQSRDYPQQWDIVEEYHEPATDDLRQQIAAQARRIEETEAHCRAHQKDADDFRKRAFAAESERQLQKGSHEKAWAERDMALRTVADLQRDLSAATTDERQLRCAYDACTRDNNQLEQDNTRLRGIIGDLEQQLAAQPKATPLEPCESVYCVIPCGYNTFAHEGTARNEAEIMARNGKKALLCFVHKRVTCEANMTVQWSDAKGTA